MALTKEIELDSGVFVRYHRVVSVNTVTNVANIIEVASYTSQEKREEEQSAVSGGEPMDVFIHTCYENTPYDQNMTIDGAYEWLKTLPSFADAGDC